MRIRGAASNWLVGVILATGIAVAGRSDELRESDQDRIQGEWKVSHWEKAGKVSTPEELLTMNVGVAKFSKDKFYWSSRKKFGGGGSFTLVEGKRPRQVILQFETGPNEGDSMVGIYELSGDTLTQCLADPGYNRPKEFVTKKGEPNTLIIFQRIKPKR